MTKLRNDTRKMFSKILGNNYIYSRGERFIVIRGFKGGSLRFRRGSVFYTEEDLGSGVEVRVENGVYATFPKKSIEPFPFKDLKVGQKVKSLVTIRCEGGCTQNRNRSAITYIRRGRQGKIFKIEDFGTYHRLVYVLFRGKDHAVYEDWEVKKI